MLLSILTSLIKKTDTLSSLAPHLVYLTGKYPYRLHPKHLIKESKQWYLPYLKREDVVLDIGCHNGQQALFAAPFCREIHAFDLDQSALNIARRDARRRKIRNVTFFIHDAEKRFPFVANTFDVVLAFAILEHLHHSEHCLLNISRVLKPKGLLLISLPNKNTWWKRWQRQLGLNSSSDRDHKKEYSEKELRIFLEKGGFSIKQILPVAFDMPLVGFIDILGGLSLQLYRVLGHLRRQLAIRYPADSISFQVIAQNEKRR